MQMVLANNIKFLLELRRDSKLQGKLLHKACLLLRAVCICTYTYKHKHVYQFTTANNPITLQLLVLPQTGGHDMGRTASSHTIQIVS